MIEPIVALLFVAARQGQDAQTNEAPARDAIRPNARGVGRRTFGTVRVTRRRLAAGKLAGALGHPQPRGDLLLLLRRALCEFWRSRGGLDLKRDRADQAVAERCWRTHEPFSHALR